MIFFSTLSEKAFKKGTDLDKKNKTSTEFFSDSVKKNSQHVQTKMFIGIPAIGTCRDRPEFL